MALFDEYDFKVASIAAAAFGLLLILIKNFPGAIICSLVAIVFSILRFNIRRKIKKAKEVQE